ncbi:MAG: peptidylprolyl isomerase [Solirubrobacterales bacterium]
MRNRSIPAALVALLACLALVACGDDDSGGSDGADTGQGETAAEPQACKEVEAPPVKDTEFKKAGKTISKGDKASVVVTTNCGEFTIELDTKKAPKTANSFAFLAEEGFYDNTVFHRIVPGFVIQGGDPGGTGDQPGTGGPGYQVEEEPPDSTAYTEGIVAMAKAGNEPPGTSGSQFYVVTGADAGLPPEYAIVGKVTDGQDVVDQIGALGDATTEQPTQTVVVQEMKLEQG